MFLFSYKDSGRLRAGLTRNAREEVSPLSLPSSSKCFTIGGKSDCQQNGVLYPLSPVVNLLLITCAANQLIVKGHHMFFCPGASLGSRLGCSPHVAVPHSTCPVVSSTFLLVCFMPPFLEISGHISKNSFLFQAYPTCPPSFSWLILRLAMCFLSKQFREKHPDALRVSCLCGHQFSPLVGVFFFWLKQQPLLGNFSSNPRCYTHPLHYITQCLP